ncbi:MAG: hypothetical protein V2A34_12895 [Lentisphaerota bacterium]
MAVNPTDISERTETRRKRIATHRALSHQDAEWDLVFGQGLSPQMRLAAAAAIHDDMKKAESARDGNKPGL